ncbi:SDR family oxidoreductase [Telmatospirillum sp.]|uniref:SDR family NAD(P)-dependent oxidoreductase n=1 Tax=Telmatospirillum sp. TaxID=2079197 RepID=UPI00283D1B0F|nr:SDR family oxidoreductase [Telmatospirillum sp.]MDR3435062.1 SDR family oxidoreductase [Telmatospirillum sp.]
MESHDSVGKGGHALVTGSNSGIGEAISRRLLHDGWQVTGLGRGKPKIEAAGFSSLMVDLCDPVALRKALEGLTVTALVHAAGFMRVGQLGQLDLPAGNDMWQVHVAAAALMADILAPKMRDGGRIVLIGSRTAAGAAGRSQYAAVKSALVGMARSWAIELAARGITVNVVAPGATETPMLLDPSRRGVPPRLPPIGRFIRPEEVAAAVAFLLSPDAAPITGQQLVICGGASL